jgi:hypothetical protein
MERVLEPSTAPHAVSEAACPWSAKRDRATEWSAKQPPGHHATNNSICHVVADLHAYPPRYASTPLLP